MLDVQRADTQQPPAPEPAPASNLARWLLDPERLPLPDTVRLARSAGPSAEALVRLAKPDGLAPLLHYRARQRGIPLAREASVALSAEYHASLSHSTIIYRDLARALAIAREQEIDVLVLKGAHVAAWLYPMPAARPMVDLDLVVRREQAPQLIEALTAHDYRMGNAEPRQGSSIEYEGYVSLMPVARGVHGSLELHSSLLHFPAYQRRLDTQDFWKRAVSCDLDGISARVLGPEDLLVYLCGHLALHHRWSRLIWLCDIALLVMRAGNSLDWERACVVARAAGLTLALAETLRRASVELNAAPPDEVWPMLAAAPVGVEERSAWEQLTRGERAADLSVWSTFQSVRGARARLGFVLAYLLPSPSYMRWRYKLRHSWQLPPAYGRRWLGRIGLQRRPK